MSGNWGEGPSHIRSRFSQPVRVALTFVSVITGLAMLVLANRLEPNSTISSEVALIAMLLALGIVFGLRPWAR